MSMRIKKEKKKKKKKKREKYSENVLPEGGTTIPPRYTMLEEEISRAIEHRGDDVDRLTQSCFARSGVARSREDGG